jgi:ABC-type branched-subunit amino acid transport system substrate-binding protein
VIDGVRVALPVPAGGSAYETFVKSFKDKFGMPPDVNALKSYDALHVAVKAVQQAGGDPAKISQYLLSPGFSHNGVSGEIRFDQNGDLVTQQYQRQIYRNGALAPF